MLSRMSSERPLAEKLEAGVDTSVYPVQEEQIVRKMASLPANALKELVRSLRYLRSIHQSIIFDE